MSRTTTRTKKDFRPRATAELVVAPVAITDLTCAAVVGLEARHFRDLVYSLAIRHVSNGRRLVVLTTDFAAALEQASSKPGAATEAQGATLDDVLARVGRRRSA